MNCVFCRGHCDPGVPTKHGQACDAYCASKLLCVFCNKVVLDNFEIPDGLFGKKIINGVQTNYGRACSDFCAAGGLVVEAMKCEAKEAPCIGHDTRLCAAVGELKRGVLASPNLEALKKGVRVHVKRCVAPACPMPHTLAAIYAKKAQPLCAPTLKRKLDVDDLAHVLRVYRAKYVPLSHQREFTEDLKRVMCREGCADLQHVLDTYTVQEAPVPPVPCAAYAEV